MSNPDVQPGQKWRTKFSHLPIIITVVESRNGEPYVEYIKGNMSGFYSHINYFLENNERLPE
jgi:hypothetical protein